MIIPDQTPAFVGAVADDLHSSAREMDTSAKMLGSMGCAERAGMLAHQSDSIRRGTAVVTISEGMPKRIGDQVFVRFSVGGKDGVALVPITALPDSLSVTA